MSQTHLPKLGMRSALLAVLLTGASSLALAQQQGPAAQQAVPATNPAELSGNRGIDRRLDRDEQTLRDLRQIVLQAKASGKPVEIRDIGPDPAIADMQAKLDDFDQAIRGMKGQLEALEHNADLSRKAVADAETANKALSARIAALEGQIQAQQTAAAPPPPPPPGQTGVLGQLPVSPGVPDQGAAPGPADEILAYRQARQVLDTGDYAGGSQALQDYLANYPNSPRAPEANYWLGRTLALRNMHPEAAAAYVRSLKGWPQSTWAGDSVVRLSASLVEMKRADDACRALTDFDARYAAKAAAAVRVRAKDVRTRAACS